MRPSSSHSITIPLLLLLLFLLLLRVSIAFRLCCGYRVGIIFGISDFHAEFNFIRRKIKIRLLKILSWKNFFLLLLFDDREIV